MLGALLNRIRPLVLGVGLATIAAWAPPAQAKSAAPTAVRKGSVAPGRAAAVPGKLRHRDLGSFARPVPNSAWAVIGFNRRPFKVGDAWRFAWSFRKKMAIRKRSIAPEERAKPHWGAPVVIDYRVTKVGRQTVAGRVRQVAMLTAIYASSVRYYLQTGNELWVDHYFNPVSRCVYTRWLLYGLCADLDTRSPIRSMGAKPLYIGNIEKLPARRVTRLPVAPVGTLRKYASKMVGGRAGFLHVPVQVGRRKFADTYWAPGHLAPSFVITPDIQGILIGQRLAR